MYKHLYDTTFEKYDELYLGVCVLRPSALSPYPRPSALSPSEHKQPYLGVCVLRPSALGPYPRPSPLGPKILQD